MPRLNVTPVPEGSEIENLSFWAKAKIFWKNSSIFWKNSSRAQKVAVAALAFILLCLLVLLIQFIVSLSMLVIVGSIALAEIELFMFFLITVAANLGFVSIAVVYMDERSRSDQAYKALSLGAKIKFFWNNLLPIEKVGAVGIICLNLAYLMLCLPTTSMAIFVLVLGLMGLGIILPGFVGLRAMMNNHLFQGSKLEEVGFVVQDSFYHHFMGNRLKEPAQRASSENYENSDGRSVVEEDKSELIHPEGFNSYLEQSNFRKLFNVSSEGNSHQFSIDAVALRCDGDDSDRSGCGTPIDEGNTASIFSIYER